MPGLIPQRPKSGKFDLKPEEMDGLSYYVLSGCTREAAFLKFMRPDFLGSKAPSVVKNTVAQFFAMKDVKNYLEAYKQTIEELFNPEKKVVASTGTLEERKARARAKAMEFAISLADNIKDAEDPETVLKLMDKVGLLDQDEQAIEQPRRCLPVSCGSCEYRKFVEENCDVVDAGTNLEVENDG